MNGTLAFNEAVCVCGRHVKGREAGSKTRGSKQMRWFECDGKHGCGHRWRMEVQAVSSPIAPSNGHSNGNGNGHGHGGEVMVDDLEQAREYLREKNEIIKAFAGSTGMTPEDVAYLRDRAGEMAVTLRLLEAEIERLPIGCWIDPSDHSREWVCPHRLEDKTEVRAEQVPTVARLIKARQDRETLSRG